MNKETIVVNHVKDNSIDDMLEEYDFSNARPNPYAGHIKKQITIRINSSTIEYFKELAKQLDMPYQSLINLCLTDYAQNKRVPTIMF